MNDIHSNSVTTTANVFSESTNWNDPDRATIYTGDIRRPWKAVYGFPTTAARLALGQELLLTCREDEIVELMGMLNELLEAPASLGRAYEMLKEHQKKIEQKLARLITLRDLPITEEEIPALLIEVERLVTGPQAQTTADRLACILSPDHPIKEIAGTGKMLSRRQMLVTALERVKDQGFHVTVRDRRRKPMRPALEARRNEPIEVAGQSDALAAGFLLPPKYHLTLWTYLVARGDEGQSAIWN